MKSGYRLCPMFWLQLISELCSLQNVMKLLKGLNLNNKNLNFIEQWFTLFNDDRFR
jgi:hypothetical protein